MLKLLGCASIFFLYLNKFSNFCFAFKNVNAGKRILQEAKLLTLSDDLCKKYGGKMKADPEVELCAGARKKSGGYRKYM